MKRRKFVSIMFLVLMLPLFSLANTNDSVQAEGMTPLITRDTIDAITTTTYKGTYNITTFVGPDNAFKVVSDSIKAAQTSFYLEVYTLSSEALVDELIAAKGRGVDVVVHLSEHRVNSYENDYTEESAWRLDNAAIDVYWIAASQFTYTHSKFWIVDTQVAYVYSGNWAPSSLPMSTDARTNREMGFAFNDSTIAQYYEDVFFDDGLNYGTAYVSGAHTGTLQSEVTGTYVPQIASQTFVEYAEITPIFAPDNSYELLSSLIENATTSIDLELQYIKFDCELLYDLIDAALGGVSVRVMIPEPGSANENVTETLINNGIQIKFFKGMYDHNKYISVDNEIVQISSINWSNNSVVNNRESGAIVKNSNIASYFKTIFDYDWANSETPVGFAEPVALASPKPGGIASGTFNIQASFAINNYTSGELFIDSVSVHTWSNPDGIEGYSVDTTTYDDGIHTIKIIGTPDVGSPVQIEEKINIINTADWLLLISEIRYDGVTEPNGEFVELYNGFSFALSIENWEITDSEGEYIIPDEAQITAGGVLVFAQDSTTYVDEMSDLGITVAAADYGLGDIALSNTGDDVLLKDPSGNTKDAVAWGSGSVSGVVSWSGGSTGDDETLQREPANSDTDDCDADFVIDTPTPGTVGAVTPEFTKIFIIPIIGLFAVVSIFIRQKRKR